MNDLLNYLPEDLGRQRIREFLDWVRDSVDELGVNLMAFDNKRLGPAECKEALLRQVHNIKGSAGAYGFATISMIAHRLEDYLAAAGMLQPKHCRDLFCFLDEISAIAQKGQDPERRDSRQVLRRLPASPGPTPANPLAAAASAASIAEEGGRSGQHGSQAAWEQEEREALIVTPSRLVNGIVRSVATGSGLRVVSTASSVEALTMAIHSKPDLVIASLVMNNLDGVDLALALRAMRVTQPISIALISSLSPSHPDLQRVPEDITVLRYGPQLSESLSSHLDHWFRTTQRLT